VNDIEVNHQHPDPWIGKSQRKRVENVFLAAPALILFGLRGRLGRLTRAYALISAPGVILNNLKNYGRLERERWGAGRPDYWWQDDAARTAQAFRVFDAAIFGPALLYAALYPKRVNTPTLRRIALGMGVATLIYNWKNYFSVEALERQQARAEKAIASARSLFDSEETV
jgi:hypothetical protein